MDVLILVRDVIIAVLLSWIGVDDGKPGDSDNDQRSTKVFHLTSDCDTPALILESQPAEAGTAYQVEWFHS